MGVFSSAACALHCLLAPTLLVLGPTLPFVFLADESFHRTMLWVLLPSAILAFGIGCWRHKDLWVLLLGAVGLLGICLTLVLPHEMLGETGERVVTVGAAIFLITAHVRNFKLCRSKDCDDSGRGA